MKMSDLTLLRPYKTSRTISNKRNAKTKENLKRKIPALHTTINQPQKLKSLVHTRKSVILKIKRTQIINKFHPSFLKCNLPKTNNKNKISQHCHSQTSKRTINKTSQSKEIKRNACAQIRPAHMSLKWTREIKRNKKIKSTATAKIQS